MSRRNAQSVVVKWLDEVVGSRDECLERFEVGISRDVIDGGLGLPDSTRYGQMFLHHNLIIYLGFFFLLSGSTPRRAAFQVRREPARPVGTRNPRKYYLPANSYGFDSEHAYRCHD
jgi:hypothetical protein